MHVLSASYKQTVMVARALKMCVPVHELTIGGACADNAIADEVVQHLQGSLQSLCIFVEKSIPAQVLICKFGKSLRHLDVVGDGATDGLLRIVGAQCPLLESIVLNSCSYITAEGIVSLLTAGSVLKKVEMLFDLSAATIAAIAQAIIANRLHLRVLRVFARGVDQQSTTEWFRQQLKDHQLLPAPEISIY